MPDNLKWTDNGPQPGEDDFTPPSRERDSNRNFGPREPGCVGMPDAAQPRHARHKPYHGLATSSAFINGMTPPDYLVDGLVQRGCAYTLTGNTGHCKTLLAVLAAINVARGGWFLGRQCRKGTVAFFAGENPDNVRYQFYAMCHLLGVRPDDLDILWHAGVFSIAGMMDRVKADLAGHPELALCIFDSLQAFFTGDDDNANVAMLNLAAGFRDLMADHPNKPSGLIIAHPVKRAARDNLLPRGGGALTNELDGNFTAWLDAESGIGELHWQGKFRGVPFDPIKFEIAVIKPEGLVDADGETMPITVVKPLGERREGELRAAADKADIQILAAIEANPAITEYSLHMDLNIPRRIVKNSMASMARDKLFRTFRGNKKRLTLLGKKTLLEHGIQPSEIARQ
ncbi:AAA family ATPase [Rhizobium mayense]|uniref:AAA family ATPase n=1 Tax=Rhizobium mayense TaxID=1312184 RepID=A0ABT7JQ04_9HYPH|nr:AAA family ATPase [Rhizobium mayense]MDL2398427.1 AAA family ATPase [Rhizobium mayense]